MVSSMQAVKYIFTFTSLYTFSMGLASGDYEGQFIEVLLYCFFCVYIAAKDVSSPKFKKHSQQTLILFEKVPRIDHAQN